MNVINVCCVFYLQFFKLRALLYVLCAFVILNKDYLLTYLLSAEFIGQMLRETRKN